MDHSFVIPGAVVVGGGRPLVAVPGHLTIPAPIGRGASVLAPELPGRRRGWQSGCVDEPEPLLLDLDDFDAVGLLSEAVVDLRAHVMETSLDTAATIAAPDGWHPVVVTAKPGGSSVIVARYAELSASRLRNVATALDGRGWQLDEDKGGATMRQAPGTAAIDVAFEVLAAVVVGGAPAGRRPVSAADAAGTPVDLPRLSRDDGRGGGAGGCARPRRQRAGRVVAFTHGGVR